MKIKNSQHFFQLGVVAACLMAVHAFLDLEERSLRRQEFRVLTWLESSWTWSSWGKLKPRYARKVLQGGDLQGGHPLEKSQRCSTITMGTRFASRSFRYSMELVGRKKLVCNRIYVPLIGRDRLGNIKACYLASGLVPRIHGNTKRLPHNTLGFVVVKNVLRFISNYAEQHAILLPGRIPGYKRDDLQLLPSHTTKRVMQFYTVLN